MSHVTTCDVKVRNLDALEQACQRLGWTLVRNQKTFAWYGKWLGDTELPHGLLTDEHRVKWNGFTNTRDQRQYLTEIFNQCDHAIKVPGAKYEIGLVRRGEDYVPVWDYWQDGGLSQDAWAPMAQAYAVCQAKMAAEANGFIVGESTLDTGSIELTLTRAW